MDYLHNSIPGLRFGQKILTSEIAGFGGYVFGDVYYVDATNGSDVNPGTTSDKAFATVDAANDAMTTNNNDAVYLSGYASHALTEMLTVAKNRVHFIGTDFDGRTYGQTTRLSMGITTAVTDVFAVKNTGIRNSFKGIKFTNANTVAQNVAGVGEGGEYTVYDSCEFYDSTEMDSDTEAEMVLNGDSTQLRNCTFGSMITAVSGDKIRPAVLLTKDTVASGKFCVDVLFDKCHFWKYAGGTTTAFIKGVAADLERVMEFHDCQFIANNLGSTPAVAIDLATMTTAYIILTGDTCAVNCTKIATDTGVISCLPTRVVTATIGVQTT